MTIRLLNVIIIGLLVFTGCSKDKKDSSQSRSEIITGDWQTIKIEISPAYDYDGDGTVDNDLFAVWEDCLKDDYTTIKPNGIYEANSGVIKCYPTEKQVYVGTWALVNNDNTIMLDGSDQAEILLLDNTTLKLRTVENEAGADRTKIITLVRK
jgi:hypothetical protein